MSGGTCVACGLIVEPEGCTDPILGHHAKGGSDCIRALQKALSASRAETAKMKDAWLRTAADFDNYRKREGK